jgi:hypothetical protein
MEQNGRSCGVSPVGSGELGADDSLDILKEDELGLALGDTSEDVRKQVSRVFVSSTLPCCAEGLTREASREDAHFAAKVGPREGLNIRPDRCCVQESRFHFSDQVRTGEGFDLTKSDCAQIGDNSAESDINAAVSGTKADVCKGFGRIHVMCLYFTLCPPIPPYSASWA